MSNIQSSKYFLFIVASLFLSNSFAVTSHVNKQVGQVQAFYDSADCIYFKLQGVSQADSIKPNDPTFAIARNQAGANGAFATLLAAKTSAKTVSVYTRGNLVCGYAGVAELYLD